MLRLPTMLSALALVLTLAACGWPDSSNDPAPTPASHGNASGSGNDGDDANIDGDTITEFAVPQDFAFSTASDLGLGRKVAVAEDGAVSLLTADGAIYVTVGADDVIAVEDGVARFVTDEGVEGEVSVPGQGLDHTAYGYWVVRDGAMGGDALEDGGALYGGARTDTNALAALSGTATYTGGALGAEYAWDAAAKSGRMVTTLEGDIKATVDFDAMTVAGRIDLRNAQGAEWGRLTFGKVGFAKDGGLSSNFSGGITSNRGHKRGFLSGHFHGPEAQEIGGRFGVSAGQGDATTQVRGSFGAGR